MLLLEACRALRLSSSQALQPTVHQGGPGEVRESLPAALQLEELRASAGGARDNDGGIPNKPLAEVLREAKEAKEEAFQNQWKTMKQGKSCQICCILSHLFGRAAFWCLKHLAWAQAAQH